MEIMTANDITKMLNERIQKLVDWKKERGCCNENVVVTLSFPCEKHRRYAPLFNTLETDFNGWGVLFDHSLKGEYIYNISVNCPYQYITIHTKKSDNMDTNIDADIIANIEKCVNALKGMTTTEENAKAKEKWRIQKNHKFALDCVVYWAKMVKHYYIRKIIISENRHDKYCNNAKHLANVLREKMNTHYINNYLFDYNAGVVKICLREMEYNNKGNISGDIVDLIEAFAA